MWIILGVIAHAQFEVTKLEKKIFLRNFNTTKKIFKSPKKILLHNLLYNS